MPKVLTRHDRLKKEYSNLYNLNQRLKNVSSIYHIREDGTVYMKSLVPFLELVVVLRYPENYELFKDAIVTPNKFFDFGKQAKKSKLIIHEIEDEDGKRFEFGQEDSSDLSYTLHISNLDIDIIKDKFVYKRIFDIYDKDNTDYERFENDYYVLSNEEVEKLVNGKYIEITLSNGHLIPLTKQMFLDVKKEDSIQITNVARQRIPSDREEYRSFYLIAHDCELYTSYTIFNKISI